MTKSFVITFDEKDENLVLDFFKRLKIKALPISDAPTKEQRIIDFKQSINEVHQIVRGERANAETWAEMLDNVAQEVNMEKRETA